MLLTGKGLGCFVEPEGEAEAVNVAEPIGAANVAIDEPLGRQVFPGRRDAVCDAIVVLALQRLPPSLVAVQDFGGPRFKAPMESTDGVPGPEPGIDMRRRKRAVACSETILAVL